MRCDCEACNGTGRVECHECDGQGNWNASIENISLQKSMRNYDELLEFQTDAKRVIRQTEKLKELNPARSDAYDQQLRGCLFVINSQAEKAAKLQK